MKSLVEAAQHGRRSTHCIAVTWSYGGDIYNNHNPLSRGQTALDIQDLSR